MLETERVGAIFADARSLYDDALAMLEQGRTRNAGEKAWGATERATDALILARTGEEPRTSGQTMRDIRSLRRTDPTLEEMRCATAIASLSCTGPVSTTASANRKRT